MKENMCDILYRGIIADHQFQTCRVNGSQFCHVNLKVRHRNKILILLFLRNIQTLKTFCCLKRAAVFIFPQFFFNQIT